MPTKPYTWPLGAMLSWYETLGKTVEEISEVLSGEEWQKYWIKHLGKEYRPTGKIVNKVLKRSGCKMRSRGAHGSRNGSWNGGRVVDKSGYVLIRKPEHPRCTKSGYVREHRLIAETVLGRYLRPEEVVHHIDDDPGNNDPSNLIVYPTNAVHISTTMKGKVPASRIEKARAARWKDHVPKTTRRKKKSSGGRQSK